MMTLLRCNQLLYALLSNSSLAKALSGGIYTGDDRPEDDTREALVIQTIAIRHEYPQSAQSNLVLYVPDKLVRIDGKEQYVANNKRLDLLSGLLIRELRELCIEGISLTIESESYFDLANIKQHALSLAIHWNIQS